MYHSIGEEHQILCYIEMGKKCRKLKISEKLPEYVQSHKFELSQVFPMEAFSKNKKAAIGHVGNCKNQK